MSWGAFRTRSKALQNESYRSREGKRPLILTLQIFKDYK